MVAVPAAAVTTAVAAEAWMAAAAVRRTHTRLSLVQLYTLRALVRVMVL
jgi:hypothetical protein